MPAACRVAVVAVVAVAVAVAEQERKDKEDMVQVKWCMDTRFLEKKNCVCGVFDSHTKPRTPWKERTERALCFLATRKSPGCCIGFKVAGFCVGNPLPTITI